MAVYSFDVFDTCITRMHARPRDLFFDLGLRVAPNALAGPDKRKFAATFQRRRERAERKAHRLARPRQAVTIDEIYACFQIPTNLTIGARDLIQAEIDLERHSIYAVAPMLSYIEGLRRDGNRIVFISDMYLPSSVLEPILLEHGVMKAGDALYVSCDVGLTKHHGQLFQHVLSAEGLNAGQLVHTGDNPRSDIRMAVNARIRARHFDDAKLLPYELKMAGRRSRLHSGWSFLPAFSRRTRLSREQTAVCETPLDHVVNCSIVPFLLAYVAWVLDHAKRNGIERLYFVARDGEILYRIANVLKGESDSIELRYLFGSRRAWLAPSISLENEDWRRFVITTGHANSRRDILGRMNLQEEVQDPIRTFLGYSDEQWSTPLSHGQARAFLSELLNNGSALDVLTASIMEMRETTYLYFKQEGLLDGRSWALVDAGWSLNSQAAMKRILEAQGSNVIPRGYYIALARDHLSEAQAGTACAFISKVGSVFSRRRVIIEHTFLPSTHPTTTGYRMQEGHSAPCFGVELRGQEELTYVRKLHEAAIDAARLIELDVRLKSSLIVGIPEIVFSAKRLLRHPSKEEAREMAKFGVVADIRHEGSFVQPLCRVLTLKDVWMIFAMAFSKRINLEAPSFMWLEGSTALSPLHVRVLLKLLLWIDAVRGWFRDSS